MDLLKIVSKLRVERDQIDDAIAFLERRANGENPVGRPPSLLVGLVQARRVNSFSRKGKSFKAGEQSEPSEE